DQLQRLVGSDRRPTQRQDRRFQPREDQAERFERLPQVGLLAQQDEQERVAGDDPFEVQLAGQVAGLFHERRDGASGRAGMAGGEVGQRGAGGGRIGAGLAQQGGGAALLLGEE